MRKSKLKEKIVIDKFKSSIRSGKDYDVKSIYEEIGNSVYVTGRRVQQIINDHYRTIVTVEMIDLVGGFNQVRRGLKKQDIDLFSTKFNVCEREARLLIRYAKYSKL